MFPEPIRVFRGEGFVPEHKSTQYCCTLLCGCILGYLRPLCAFSYRRAENVTVHRRIPAVNISRTCHINKIGNNI